AAAGGRSDVAVSAPIQASASVQVVPASNCVRSSTRIPAKYPGHTGVTSIVVSLSGMDLKHIGLQPGQLANLLDLQPIRRTAEKTAELGNRVDVGLLGCWREVANRHVVDHASRRARPQPSSLLTHRWREPDSNLYGAFPVKSCFGLLPVL